MFLWQDNWFHKNLKENEKMDLKIFYESKKTLTISEK